MKSLLTIIFLLTTLSSLSQEKPDSVWTVLPKNGVWSVESYENSHLRCRSKLADSLALEAERIALGTFTEIDSMANYSFEFTKTTDWRIDFKNLDVYRHECFELNNRKELPFKTLVNDCHIGEVGVSSWLVDGEEWLLIRVHQITMLGNSQEGIDFEYFYRKVQ